MKYALLRGEDPMELGTALEDPLSAELMALDWLGLDDDYEYDWVENCRVLVQQFVLAALYYSTSGGGNDDEGWKENASFLSGADVCDWNDGKRMGVWCNDVEGRAAPT